MPESLLARRRIQTTVRAPLLVLLALLASWVVQTSSASAVPPGFEMVTYVSGLNSVTAMAFAPGGSSTRIFVAEKGGNLRVVENGTLLPTPFASVSVQTSSERGLLGVAFDPNFASNRWVYVYYTNASPTKNRVSRFTASASNPNVAVPGSEVVILDNITSNNTRHQGGAIQFGLDGMLYVAVGDDTVSSNSQTLANLNGKLLRINPAAFPNIVPPDNPFVGVSGARGEIWAYGLRNPFTFAIDPGSGRIYINDVGQDAREEINRGVAGANYGWPTCEGPCGNPSFHDPIYSYSHGSGGAAITGAAFYPPAGSFSNPFPSEYVGNFFFSDYVQGFMRRLTPSGSAIGFENVAVIDIDVGPDGSLYALDRSSDRIRQIRYIGAGNQVPNASASANPSSGPSPLSVSFNGSASSDPDGDPLSYSWNFDDPGSGSNTASGATANHVYANPGVYDATLTVNDGNGGQDSTTVRVSVGGAPTASIISPATGATYRAGDTISFSGSGTDPDDGTLPASALDWVILFHHDEHTHPFQEFSGTGAGQFTIPTVGETSPNVWYRLHLAVTDSTGLTHEVTRDVVPVRSTMTFQTQPPGLQITIDGAPLATPQQVVGVVGMRRAIGAAATQTVLGQIHQFESWSDGGAATHSIVTPASNTSYVATYTLASGGGGGGTGGGGTGGGGGGGGFPPPFSPAPTAPTTDLHGFEPSGTSLWFLRGNGTPNALLSAMAGAGANASSCTVSSLVFGQWVSYFPGAQVQLANSKWLITYPLGVPPEVPLFSRCPGSQAGHSEHVNPPASAVPSLRGFTPAGQSLWLVIGGGADDKLLAEMTRAGANTQSCRIASLRDGRWTVFIPASRVVAVNAAWRSLYPLGVPDETPLYSRCS